MPRKPARRRPSAGTPKNVHVQCKCKVVKSVSVITNHTHRLFMLMHQSPKKPDSITDKESKVNTTSKSIDRSALPCHVKHLQENSTLKTSRRAQDAHCPRHHHDSRVNVLRPRSKRPYHRDVFAAGHLQLDSLNSRPGRGKGSLCVLCLCALLLHIFGAVVVVVVVAGGE